MSVTAKNTRLLKDGLMHLQPSNPMPDYYAAYFHALGITGCQVWCAIAIHELYGCALIP